MLIKTRKTHSAGGVVVNGKGEVVLVCQQKRGRVISWSFPKGGILKGEGVLEAAKREIKEESGIENLEWISNLGKILRDKTIFQIKVIHMFLFRTDQEELSPIDPDNPEALWIAIDKVADRLTHRKDKEFFVSVMDEVRRYSR